MFNIFWSNILGSIALVVGAIAVSFIALFIKEIIKQLQK